MIMMLVFTAMPLVSYAATSRPGKVQISGKPKLNEDKGTLIIKFKKVAKCTGYKLFRVIDGEQKSVKDVKYSKTFAKNKKLTYKKIDMDKEKCKEKGTKNCSYIVKAYNKKIKYYNTKTKKWQSKKPAKKYLGKKKEEYVYSKTTSTDAVSIAFDIVLENEEEQKEEKNTDTPAGSGTTVDVGPSKDVPVDDKSGDVQEDEEKKDDEQEQEEEKPEQEKKKDTGTERLHG